MDVFVAAQPISKTEKTFTYELSLEEIVDFYVGKHR